MHPAGFELAIPASERPTMNIIRLLEIIVHLRVSPTISEKNAKIYDIMEMLQVAKNGKYLKIMRKFTCTISAEKSNETA